jgi:hypothetical protein
MRFRGGGWISAFAKIKLVFSLQSREKKITVIAFLLKEQYQCGSSRQWWWWLWSWLWLTCGIDLFKLIFL